MKTPLDIDEIINKRIESYQIKSDKLMQTIKHEYHCPNTVKRCVARIMEYRIRITELYSLLIDIYI